MFIGFLLTQSFCHLANIIFSKLINQNLALFFDVLPYLIGSIYASLYLVTVLVVQRVKKRTIISNHKV
jgi:hypothetical protein